MTVPADAAPAAPAASLATLAPGAQGTPDAPAEPEVPASPAPAAPAPAPHGDADLPEAPAEHWEARYTRSERVWSGQPNPTTVQVISEHLVPPVPGEPAPLALDLGCGEGADAIWLASSGWRTTGVDLSTTAISRARDAAAASGTTDVAFEVADLSRTLLEGPFDLVVASFFHAHVELPRTQVLRRAAAAVRAGGHLLLVTHASPPPWSQHRHDEPMPSPAEDWAALDLPAERWTLEACEVVGREAVSPEGQVAVLQDGVVLARRSA